MLAKLNTFALVGIHAVPVEVEVDAVAGLPKTILVVWHNRQRSDTPLAGSQACL